MVELRKRKTPPPAPVRPTKKKADPKPATSKAAKVKETVAAKVESVKEAVTGTNGAKKESSVASAPAVGDSVDLVTFGGEIETHEGTKTTLKALVEESKGGVVLFTYPKASTPGCTTQACLFRDSFAPLTATGLQIYGLSSDSPKSNTTFKTKQNLPYTLLCDPSNTLIKAIGMQKAPKGTKRGVFVVDKAGKVLAAEAGGPAVTVDVVKKLVGGDGAAPEAKEKEDVDLAKTASEVADTAAKLDG